MKLIIIIIKIMIMNVGYASEGKGRVVTTTEGEVTTLPPVSRVTERKKV